MFTGTGKELQSCASIERDGRPRTGTKYHSVQYGLRCLRDNRAIQSAPVTCGTLKLTVRINNLARIQKKITNKKSKFCNYFGNNMQNWQPDFGVASPSGLMVTPGFASPALPIDCCLRRLALVFVDRSNGSVSRFPPFHELFETRKLSQENSHKGLGLRTCNSGHSVPLF